MIQLDNAIARFKVLILDEMKEAKIQCWLGGGCLRDYFAGLPLKTDYDMFFPNEEEYNKAKKYFTDKNATVKWESENGCKVVYKDKTYDLVKKFFSDPEASIQAFDFTVCMFAIDTEKVYYGETTFIDLSKRQLMINKITYPASTLSRAFRYYQKGFRMCAGEMKKLFEAIQNSPKETPPEEDENAQNEQELSGGAFRNFFRGID